MRYIIALAVIGAGAFYILGDDRGPADERLPNASTATVSSGYSDAATPKAFFDKPIAEIQDLSESGVGADRLEQANLAVGKTSSADSAVVTFDLGPFIDPDDMSTWPDGQELIVGEYIDPEEFFADEQPPIEIGEWIDPDVEYGPDGSEPIELGVYEDPESPTPSGQKPVEIGEFIDPENP